MSANGHKQTFSNKDILFRISPPRMQRRSRNSIDAMCTVAATTSVSGGPIAATSQLGVRDG